MEIKWLYDVAINPERYAEIIKNYSSYKEYDLMIPEGDYYEDDFLMTLKIALLAMKSELKKEIDFKSYLDTLKDHKSVLGMINEFLKDTNNEHYFWQWRRDENRHKKYFQNVAKMLKQNSDELLQMYDSIYLAFESLDKILNSVKERGIGEKIENFIFSEDINTSKRNLKILDPVDYRFYNGFFQNKLADILCE